MTRLTFVVGIGLTSALTFAADYEVRFDSASQMAEIRITVPQPKVLSFNMPAWIPGDYQIFNYGKTVRSVQFRKGGSLLGANQVSVNQWASNGEADQVIYLVGTSKGNFSDNLAFRGSVSFICGGAYGWLSGHQSEAQNIRFYPLPGESIYTVLPSTAHDTFTAENFDDLLDSPTVVGKDVLSLDGSIRIVGYGNTSGVDIASFQKLGEKVANEAKKMLPGKFTDKYTFFLSFGGSGGGLEHRNSSVITLFSKSPQSATSIMFHEFFHAYNVKRIRPEAIWNFDYSKAPVIDSLWWLEGVTDYYADVFEVRSGLKPREAFLNGLGQNATREKNRSATVRTSALVSSQKVFEVEGSQGAGGVSYYSKGWLVGAALDMSIRQNSMGKYSLDDVMRGLWSIAQGENGYPESEIRKLCVKFGGEATGTVYDQSVTIAQAVPIGSLVAGLGLKFEGNAIVDDVEGSAISKTLGKQFPLMLPLTN